MRALVRPRAATRLGPEDFTDPAASSERSADLRGDIAHLKHLPDCLLILVPQRSATLADTLDRAHWLAGFAAGRAWLALELWQDGSDDERLASCRVIAEASGLPLVAASGALMHARSRKPLQDTLTAIRLNRPLAECGYALEANAERHLRTRLRIGALYPKEAIRRNAEGGRPLHLLARRTQVRISRRTGAARRDARELSAQAGDGGRAAALAERHGCRDDRSDRKGTGARRRSWNTRSTS